MYAYFVLEKNIYTRAIKSHLRLYGTYVLGEKKIELLFVFAENSGFVRKKTLKEKKR